MRGYRPDEWEKKMNYITARQYITDAGKYGSVLGLEVITELMNRLGNPQDNQYYVHVAGTNGKGSTITYIDQILSAAGYKVGKYMSPAVFEYREAFQVEGRMIEEEVYAQLMTIVARAADKMEEDGFPHPTSFEMETAMAFMFFTQSRCDIVLLETGMGGETDATNIIKENMCSVITSISLDHMRFLGDTVEEIAEVKAGIIKYGSDVVVTDQKQSVIDVIRSKAEKRNCTFHVGKVDSIRELSMKGVYQQNNAATAKKVVEVLISKGYTGIIRDTIDCIDDGLANAYISGRFEKINDEPEIIIDGAHNPGAVTRLKDTLELYFTNKKITFIMGVLSDKDYNTEAGILFDNNSRIITVTTPGIRGLSAEELADTLQKYSDNVVTSDSIYEAVKMAAEDVKQNNSDVIVAFGSLSYLGELRKVVKEEYYANR